MDIYKMFIYGTVMIFITLLARISLKRFIPRFAFVIMWYLSAVRLIVPFDIRFRFSAYSPAAEAVKNTAVSVEPSLIESPHTVNMVPSYDLSGNFQFLKIIWFAGIILMAIYFTVLFVIYMRKISGSILAEINLEDFGIGNIKRSIKILVCKNIDSPFTGGIIFPKIFLPAGSEKSCSDDKGILKYVLLHEYVHIKRFDTLGKLILAAALCINWFNPAVWLMFVLASRDMEISCDESVINITGEKKDYAMALIMSEERRSCGPAFTGFSKNIVEERICHIMKYKNKNKLSVICASALIIMSAAAFTTSPEYIKAEAKNSTPISENKEDTLLIWPVENCYTITAPYSGSNTNGSRIHNCVDISGDNAEGSAIYAAASGIVEEAGYSFDKGNYIVISHDNGIKTRYTNCKEIYVSAGEKVEQGYTIAVLGNTGISTGAHLGFSVMINGEYTDPMTYFE